MPWAALDDHFHSDPKVLAAGNAGAGLYARCLSYCADNLTDGYIPIAWVKGISTPKLRQLLIDVGLWQLNGTGYLIPTYLNHNPSRDDVLIRKAELAAKRSAAGKKGAQTRWQKP